MNLNVYAYCQSCGRGWEGPPEKKQKSGGFSFWIFGKRNPV
jgi:hypothetical protein